jgi:hypothetical protein
MRQVWRDAPPEIFLSGTLTSTILPFETIVLQFTLMAVDAAMTEPLYLGWALAVYFALVALLKWKYRRTEAERRVNRGLRTYTAARRTYQDSNASLVA